MSGPSVGAWNTEKPSTSGKPAVRKALAVSSVAAGSVELVQPQVAGLPAAVGEAVQVRRRLVPQSLAHVGPQFGRRQPEPHDGLPRAAQRSAHVAGPSLQSSGRLIDEQPRALDEGPGRAAVAEIDQRHAGLRRGPAQESLIDDRRTKLAPVDARRPRPPSRSCAATTPASGPRGGASACSPWDPANPAANLVRGSHARAWSGPNAIAFPGLASISPNSRRWTTDCQVKRRWRTQGVGSLFRPTR